MKNFSLLISVVFGLGNLATQAQNLVPNPSFEDTVSCPTSANQIDKAIGWHASQGTSPDYFHECDFVLTGTTAVPSNFCGYQFPNFGNAYVGLITFSRSAPNSREYFYCQLLNPLETGFKYFFSFYISLSGGISTKIASNKMGLKFTTYEPDTMEITNSCQFSSNAITIDTVNWVNIMGSFIADSNYQFMTIGNFYDDSQTDTIVIPPLTSHSYYYFDNISIIKDTIESINNIFISSQVSIFPNPISNVLTIESTRQILKIEITNMLGNLILCQSYVHNNQIEISFENIINGTYFIKIFYPNNLFTVHKLLKI